MSVSSFGFSSITFSCRRSRRITQATLPLKRSCRRASKPAASAIGTCDSSFKLDPRSLTFSASFQNRNIGSTHTYQSAWGCKLSRKCVHLSCLQSRRRVRHQRESQHGMELFSFSFLFSMCQLNSYKSVALKENSIHLDKLRMESSDSDDVLGRSSWLMYGYGWCRNMKSAQLMNWTLFGLIFCLMLPQPAEAFGFSDIESVISSAGPLAPIVFVILYIISAVFLIPGSFLTVAAGFLFGPLVGTLAVSVGSTLGATAAFLVGRSLARPWVLSKFGNESRIRSLDTAIGSQGAKIVLLLRLSPLFPYSVLNYALSLTSVPLGSYIAASWAGMLPATVAYVALGGAGKAAAESASGDGISIAQLVVYALGVAGTLGATVLISRIASQTLKNYESEEEDE